RAHIPLIPYSKFDVLVAKILPTMSRAPNTKHTFSTLPFPFSRLIDSPHIASDHKKTITLGHL
ncbi:hypothetical protein QN360_15900, partial [Glaciimonas sp. CA11.2]|uniref:hypothetical protein n=1 Tax=Glaciimonas sp. CA11.2 TaxID=3048601 RepID=UPI002B238BAD